LRNDTLSFCELAKKYSDHKRTKSTCGFFIDPNYGTTKIPMDYLDKDIALAIADMKPGETSNSILATDETNQRFYRILYLKSETPPHVANLEQDWQKIQLAANEEKKAKALEDWVDEKRKKVYIHISKTYANCEMLDEWNNNKF
jgi:peptidyl-prolyl cis-trans isomerase SurA